MTSMDGINGRSIQTLLEGNNSNNRGHEKWAVKRGRAMQICVRNHVDVHPQKKKEVLYFVKKNVGEISIIKESDSDSVS